jgi:assimilatory nitrate reductase catalytic subunit
LAASYGIGQSEKIRLITRRGSGVFAARLTHDIRLDTLFVPFHWGGAGSVNVLTNPALDPTSRMPEFKVCAAQIEKITLEPHNI